MADSRPVVAEPLTERAQAFLRLADDHLDAAYRLARAILHDATDAQDATHDAFERAWRKWSTLRDPARFEPWFDRILVNTCRDRLRSAHRQATDISVEVAMASGDHIGQANDRDVLANAIASLSPDHRVVVALRYYCDLPVEEIARRLAIPAGTVQSRLHYALKRLHSEIDTADGEETIR
jgi:RNA polymerase sigma-70 factor (ECF subfamily)